MNKRHAKPSAAALLNRIYRQQIALRAEFASLQSGQRMLSERMESFRVIVDHCARLLREKETLMSMIDQQKIMAEPVEHNPMPHSIWKCAFASTHRPGVRCAICENWP